LVQQRFASIWLANHQIDRGEAEDDANEQGQTQDRTRGVSGSWAIRERGKRSQQDDRGSNQSKTYYKFTRNNLRARFWIIAIRSYTARIL
jgi:hypothetical protein